ncbi:ATP-binding protein [Jiangella alba]|uniref:Regulatory protein, luxR family n=1 Tax=Jiangella alba TaxID=561176 RepID=A0A1H5L8V2_9ACTN|nr:LuxR family transcriptional regulator [Jiangella alba]SEE73532.1 regulatory protein, luxR family [Jiangella alba]
MGRRAERETVEHVLTRAQAGHSEVLVVRGEAGIGKTALLEHARDTAVASGFRSEFAVGVESETQFAFAGLHQLCAPLLDRAGALPEPQQTALNVAFGLRSGAAPERFLVGLATLNLLAEAAEEQPLLCLVDDAQWLDQASAQVLAFVARRVAAEQLVLVFGLRDPGEEEVLPFAGLPELWLGGLSEADARALLAAVSTPLDDGVRDRIVAEARGNPLALLELPRSTHPAELAGGFELPDVLGAPRRVELSFQDRFSGLPVETQVLMLAAAAEPTGEVALLWRAAAQLGIAREAAAPAEAAGLLEIGTRVRFRHPLVRSAVYRAATSPDQRRVHGALAAATDPRADPDRHAWHRAHAVLGTDEDAAAELERSAGRARARGGLAAAAAFLQQAADLTPEPARRTSRALAAAYAKHEAGATEAALELLDVAASGPLDALQRARLELLRAQIAFHLSRGRDGPWMLLDAAKTLAPLDAALARETYLRALDAAIVTGAPGRGVPAVAEAARAAPPPPTSPEPADELLDGLVTTFTQGYEAGVPGLRRALTAFAGHEPPADAVGDSDSHRWLWLASRTAMAVFDDESAHLLADRHVRLAREAGALATLPAALLVQSVMLVISGEFARASELAAAQTSITASTTALPLLHAQLILAAWRGRSHETAEIHTTIARETAGHGHDTEVSLAQYALAVLHNGRGDYQAAQAAAARAFESDELTYSNLAHSELIEAASRTGQPELAADALDQLSSRALASGTPWGLGLAARSRALTSTGPVAEEHYREAIEQLRNCRMAGHLARAHLVYGEWLRREGRRQAARAQLRTAHDLLSEMGAEAFAARAGRELRATGEHPRKRTAQPTDVLTAHELHIARLVATGATSREVGAQLFLSPRTIEAHLRNIFRKLGITSRRQLRELRLP